MSSKDIAHSYGLDRKLTPGEKDVGIALVRLGLQPLCVVNLFSNRGAVLEETRRAIRAEGDRRRRAAPATSEEALRAREKAKAAKRAYSLARRRALSKEERQALDRQQYERKKQAAQAKRETGK